jgi:predicted ATP-grasp superfamily ATP-dependent carboligase
VFPVSVCRSLARRGAEVHVFAEAGSPMFRSRYCHRGIASGPWTTEAEYLARLDRVVDEGRYETIYVASEPIVQLLVRHGRGWPALPLPPPAAMAVILSKHSIVRRVADRGAPVPRTIVPDGERDLDRAAQVLRFPLLVKGERGTASAHVRVCRDLDELRECFRLIVAREALFGGRPALQEAITGPKYTFAGLFRNGVALRIVAYRAILTCPPAAGETVMLVTESPPGLVPTAQRVFEALDHTGMGSAELMFDPRDGGFKFIDFAPRLWGNVGAAEAAGVDLFGPYRALACGEPIAPDLRFATGVVYRRPSGILRRLLMRPQDLGACLRDTVDPRVRSDFAWRDPWPHWPFQSWRRRDLLPAAATSIGPRSA